MHRLTAYSILAGMVLLGGLARAQDPAVSVQGYQILGPASPSDFARWIADMKQWRMEYRKRIGYDDSEYRRPELQWTQSSFMQPQMMVEDRYFYDPVAGRYTVDRYLDDLEKRFGGIDSRAHLAGVSEYRHRQPQPVRSLSRPAGRHRRNPPDGGRFSQARRARPVPHHAVGPGHTGGSP